MDGNQMKDSLPMKNTLLEESMFVKEFKVPSEQELMTQRLNSFTPQHDAMNSETIYHSKTKDEKMKVGDIKFGAGVNPTFVDTKNWSAEADVEASTTIFASKSGNAGVDVGGQYVQTFGRFHGEGFMSNPSGRIGIGFTYRR